ncbi:hypothetical protein HaLaN_23894 [Haematococcus lacustris]|uniref:Uncharacterized protein n=1 Tax=Haematococcus lacustris TaxID=44745 RepID=A0A6A0A1V6_HAELA|nr:hypothetical protein HaLaN_23894 [Haematococcus lacustris]
MACGALRACIFSANFATDATERLTTLLFFASDDGCLNLNLFSD